MNKSLLTNICSLLLIGIGYITPKFPVEIKAMGLFSFSGAITNWLAIHMLFEKIPFLYGSGIVTERFEEFKEGIRSLIMKQFFTKENLDKFLSETSGSLNIDGEKVADAVDFDKVFDKLKTAIVESPFGGMLGMFGGEQALEPLKPSFEIHFKEVISEIANDEKFVQNLIDQKGSSNSDSDFANQVEDIVNGRLDELTPQMVKKIIQDMIKEHLGWLVVWGGVFGALIGLLSTFFQ